MNAGEVVVFTEAVVTRGKGVCLCSAIAALLNSIKWYLTVEHIYIYVCTCCVEMYFIQLNR